MSQNMHSFSNHFRDRYYIDINSLTRATLISPSWEGRNTCLWIYCKKMYILRPEKFFFHLYVSVVVCWINFQSRHLQAYYKCGISVVWRGMFPLAIDLFLKIDTPKKETKSLKNNLKRACFQESYRPQVCNLLAVFFKDFSKLSKKIS